MNPNNVPPSQPNQNAATNMLYQLRNMLQSAQSILISLPVDANEDAMAAGLALYIILNKLRKNPTIVCARDVQVDRAHLFSIDKITKQIAGGSTLVVSMPYAEGSIEKVSYNIENNRFNLVIEPRDEKLTFNPDDIEYNYGKGDYDAVFVIGANKLEDLGVIYTNHKNVFTNKPVVNIGNSQQTNNFGRINIIQNAPLSQIITVVLKSLRIPIEQDPASNLFTGIVSVQGTISFESSSPDTLEAVAFLMRSQAKQLRMPDQVAHQKTLPVQSDTPPNDSNIFQSKNNNQKSTTMSLDQEVKQEKSTIDDAPEDWLKPKIFHTNKQAN